ncbi:hypothetical protein GEMRC1_003749 [Eukaryota sp. GEM-RC1]
MAGGASVGARITPLAALSFTFNMAVGIGSMSLPKVFQTVGFLLGTIFILVLAVFAYISSTFVIESLSIVNALLDKDRSVKSINADHNLSLHTPLINIEEQKPTSLSPFHLHRRTEYVKVAAALFPRPLLMFFNVVFLSYFLGDLIIYATGVPIAVKQIFGETIFVFGNEITGMALHRYIIVIFGIIITPLSLADYQKTRVLQSITLVLRIVAFYTMIIIGLVYVLNGRGTPVKQLPVFNLKNLPVLFGGTCYSMMCHHSLASTITPLNDHKHAFPVLRRSFYADGHFLHCSLFNRCHCANSPSGTCQIQDLYLQNFASHDYRIIAWSLMLFPLAIFVTLYPMIVMTLKQNLEQFLPFKPDSTLKRPFCTSFSIIVPLSIGLVFSDLKAVIGLVGTFCGSWIMFGFPCLFAFYARRVARREFPNTVDLNCFASNFSSNRWIYLVFGFFSIIFGVPVYRLVASFLGF